MNGKAPLLDLWYPLPAQGPAPSPARLLREASASSWEDLPVKEREGSQVETQVLQELGT